MSERHMGISLIPAWLLKVGPGQADQSEPTASGTDKRG